MVPTFPVEENVPNPVDTADNVTGLSEYAVTVLVNDVLGATLPKPVAVTHVGGFGLFALPQKSDKRIVDPDVGTPIATPKYSLNLCGTTPPNSLAMLPRDIRPDDCRTISKRREDFKAEGIGRLPTSSYRILLNSLNQS